jgi:superfamily I DNA/RNA helicase
MMKQPNSKLHASLRFFHAYHKLPVNAQGPVWECVNKLMKNPAHPSLNYEAIRMAGDPRLRSVRVNDSYRVIVAHPDGSGTYILLWVDKHDEAYGWAARHHLETGDEVAGLELVEDTEQQKEPDQAGASAPQSSSDTTPEAPVEGYLHLYSDAQLLEAGVPETLLPRLRACRTDAAVEDVLSTLPQTLAALVLDLWTGQPRAVLISEASGPEAESPASVGISDTLEIALRRPGSARHFVAISTEEELKQALKYPLQLWRVFLHPEQKAIVRAYFDGPALVSGSAGTGKTVVGLHRARYLASEVFTAPTDRVLLTTYTYTLAQDLDVLIESLCGGNPSVRQRIEVKHVHSLAKQIRALAREWFDTPREGEDRQLMQEVVRQYNPLNLPAAFYFDEWEEVVQERDALTEEAYLQVDRAGRGRALSRRKRSEIWQVFEMYRRKLAASGKEEWPSVVRRARELIETGQVQFPSRYRAVIVDEAQDMGTQEMRLLLALVGQGPESLLLLGDTRQQIYKRGSYIHLLNISIGRRHMRLRLNYRTTEQIRAAASNVLTGGTALTGEPLRNDDSISLLQGPTPRVRCFASEAEETAAVVAQVRETLLAMQPEEVVVVARTNAALTRYAEALRAVGIPNTKIEKGPRGPGVQLATMHRVKGLEFRAVFLVNCTAGVVPQPKRGDVGDEVARAEHEERERRLLYVAMTRARELLWISGTGSLSPFLEIARSS